MNKKVKKLKETVRALAVGEYHKKNAVKIHRTFRLEQSNYLITPQAIRGPPPPSGAG